MSLTDYCIIPDWPAPANIKALQTTRQGGVSVDKYASLNLGDHVGDNPLDVAQNRQLLASSLPGEPVWLDQVHGVNVVQASHAGRRPQADGSVAARPDAVCVVMTADCLPVLLCDKSGSVVGAAHAGWRGLCDGIIEQTVRAMQVSPQQLLAWLGPAIGPRAFEVGDEVRSAFLARQSECEDAFTEKPNGKWLADIYRLARLRLQGLGITGIHGGEYCTFSDSERFFSYRRDGKTGRMGTFIWMDPGRQ